MLSEPILAEVVTIRNNPSVDLGLLPLGVRSSSTHRNYRGERERSALKSPPSYYTLGQNVQRISLAFPFDLENSSILRVFATE